jgi:hypothetical protein
MTEQRKTISHGYLYIARVHRDSHTGQVSLTVGRDKDIFEVAEFGFIEWFRRADEIGFTPHVVAGSCHLKLHLRHDDQGRAWLHVSGPVTDPPGQAQHG